MSTQELRTLTLSPDNPTNTSITNLAGDVLYSVITEHAHKATYTQVRRADDEVIGSLEWREVLADRVRVGDRRPISLWEWMRKSAVPFKDQVTFVDDRGRKYKWRGLAPGSILQLFTEDDSYTSPIANFQRSRAVYPTPLAPARLTSPSSGSIVSLSPTVTSTTAGTLIESSYTSSLTPLSETQSDTQSIAFTLVDGLSSEPVTREPRRRTPATLSLAPRAVEIQDLVVMSFLFLEKYRRARERGTAANSTMMYRHGC